MAIKTFEQFTAASKLNHITAIVKSAAEKLADSILKDLDWAFLKNATDLNTCDYDDIARIISLVYDDKYLSEELTEEPFSIEDICNQKKHYECVDAIDEWVEENWEDYLDENSIDALYDLFDTGGILDKDLLNGGRFESFRDFQNLVSENVINKIKETFVK
jgi:hypothetical protein